MRTNEKPDFLTPPISLIGQESYRIRPARSFSEKCNAWNLVYSKYIESGFIKAHPAALFFSVIDLLPTTTCLVAKSDQDMGGTMSLAVNSTAGLPGGICYEGDLRRLGIDGRVIGEMTKLAVSSSSGNSNIATNLMAALIYWSWNNHIDDVVCVVHPRHGRAWSSVFGWRPVGDTKLHPGVNDQPGVLLHLDLKRVTRTFETFPPRGQRLLRAIAEQGIEAEGIFRPSGSEIAALSLECPRVLSKASPRLRTCLDRHFPWAYHILSSLFSEGTFGRNPHLMSRPQRDRQLAYPNQISEQRAATKNPLYNQAAHDHLLYSDMPLVLFIGPSSARVEMMHRLLESSGFITIRCLDAQGALLLVRENVFDVIFLDSIIDDPLTSTLTLYIRERDAALDFHTLIIELVELFHIIQSASQALVSEREAMAAVVTTLRVIAEGTNEGNRSLTSVEKPQTSSTQKEVA